MPVGNFEGIGPIQVGGSPISGFLEGEPSVGGSTVTILGQFPVLAAGPAMWSIREGVLPVVEDFFIRPEDRRTMANARYGIQTPITLEFKTSRGQVTFKNLWVMDFPPGPHPGISVVRIADRRFFWQFAHILHRFNVRRRVGVLRATDPVAELSPVVQDIQYARWSLNAGGNSKWAADDVVKKVLEELIQYESRHGGSAGQVIIDTNLAASVRAVPIEDLEIDDRGDQAVARALSYLPSAGVFVNPDGNIVVYSKADAAERRTLQAAGPEAYNLGHADQSILARRRPQQIDVLFSYEVEVRFDYKEPSGTTTAVLTEEGKEFARRLDNVLPVPDFSLRLPGGRVAQGTWITVDQAIAAWENAPGINQPLSHDFIRRAAVPFIDLWSPFLVAGSADPNSDWAGRIAAVMGNWRSTFRLPQRWVDRMLSLRAYQVATVDVTTGTRAPAHAYADYTIIATQRTFFGIAPQIKRPDTFQGIVVSGYPSAEKIDEQTKPIPALVSVVDADQGIIRLDHLPDPVKVFTVILPGKLDNAPVEDVAFSGRAGHTIMFDAVPEGTAAAGMPQLAAGWKCAVILTLIPAAPNSVQQLHRVTVKPSDISDMVPPAAKLGLTDALGPPMEVRVPASMETARIRWDDDRSQTIAALFGIGIAEESQGPSVDGLIINKTSVATTIGGFGVTGASLESIARAIAARIYTSLSDRVIGQATVDLSDAASRSVPGGSLDEVRFEIHPDGKALVSFRLPEKGPEFAIWSFLDDGTRAIVMHLVQGRTS